MKRVPWWGWLAIALITVFAGHFLLRFPWRETLVVLAATNGPLLVAAALINLTSFIFKGWAWQLLLKPVAPVRWRTAQEALFVGSAVNNIAVSVSGEAARVHIVMQRDGVPAGAAIASVIWSRIVEGMSLAIFLVAFSWFFELPGWMRMLRLALAIAFGVLFLVMRLRLWPQLSARLPERLRLLLRPVFAVAGGAHLGWPIILCLCNWLAEWLTFHLAILATGAPIPYAVSLVALVFANIGGIPRVTPANIGILQASIIVGMLPFGIPEERAAAAGVALQAVQVFPVIGVALLLTGWKGLRSLMRSSATAVSSA
ncbi:MAG: lysylphosphatidylglycerol synthase transmembrane domain-containing protein [Gemmatimonadota bacterium]